MNKEFLVQDIMSKNIICVYPDTSLIDAGRIIARHRFNGVPVVDKEKRLVGIVTEYSIIRNTLLPRHRSDIKTGNFLVQDVMNSEPLTLHPEATFDEIMTAFRDHHSVNPIPVVDSTGHLVGVISRSDMLKDIEGAS